MSRSGYSEDYDDENFPNATWLYQANVERSMKGKRGQQFFVDLIAALDAMSEKRLVADDLIRPSGEVCALGALALSKGIAVEGVDPDDARTVAARFKISECLAREVVFQNDEAGWDYKGKDETPEQRWTRIRNWAGKQILT